MKRTHTCGELKESNVDDVVTLCGWVTRPRNHGGLIFVDLRDKYGITQLVFDEKVSKENFEDAYKFRREDVIGVTGKVRARVTENPNIGTGKIELFVENLTIINKAEMPPIEVDDEKVASDEMRLKYRYLDLRRPKMQYNLRKRHEFIAALREYANNHLFTEIETPMLVKSTPEGARDYMVPSRVNPGKLYALPQSPQLYKQILMIAGCDRYYQIAKCLRDEDLRADRQPEHTQFDFEMSFVEQEDIREFSEAMLKHTFEKVFDISVSTPFPTFSYKEAMDRFGSDKPDIRYGLELTDLSEIVKDCGFAVFEGTVKDGNVVKAINPSKAFGRKDLDRYTKFAQENGAKGLAFVKVTENLELDGGISKFLSEESKKAIIEAVNPEKESVIMFVADSYKKANAVLDKLRRRLAKDLELYSKNDFKFAWVNDFPLFAWNEDDNKWEPEHHMFSMPKKEFIDTMEDNPAEVLGDLWDLTLNGWEMSSGSIRVSNTEIQKRIMKIIGMDEKEAMDKFGFLLEAYKYGAPSHGGMGMGLARFLTIALGEDDIREVISFPKNKNAQCPMDGCPSIVPVKITDELNVTMIKLKEN